MRSVCVMDNMTHGTYFNFLHKNTHTLNFKPFFFQFSMNKVGTVMKAQSMCHKCYLKSIYEAKKVALFNL